MRRETSIPVVKKGVIKPLATYAILVAIVVWGSHNNIH